LRSVLLLLSASASLLLIACSGGSSPSTTAAPRSPAAVHATPDATCQLEAQSRSINSNTATSFTITNQTSDQLTVFWLDFQGKRVKYFDLPAGSSHQQGTFVTHPWVVADPSGNCVRVFMVTTAATITID
jgi:von Hippel-Lindau disease tumor suppressor protein